MNKRSLILLLLLAGFVMPLLAQSKNKKVEDRIQLARDKYTDGLALIAYNSDEGHPVNYATVVREQNWAAIGPKTDKMEFYYKEIEEEYEPYPVGYTLCMARRTFNQTVRNHLEEYVFDDNGKPLFFFSRFEEIVIGADIDYAPVFEIRLYYDENGHIIRTIYKMSDENGKMQEFTAKSHPKILESINYYINPSFSYIQKIFDAIYNN